MDEDTPVGQRIAYWRRRRGLSQATLAGLAGVSVSYLSKVEQGQRTLDRVPVLSAIADVLRVSLGDLLGGVELDLEGGAPLDPPPGLVRVRRAVLRLERAASDAPNAAELHADLEHVQRLAHGGSLEALSDTVPDLIAACRAAIEADVPGAWWCLSGAYREAAGLGRALGDTRLSWVAADRATEAAERSGDETLVGAAQRQVAHALMREGWLEEAGVVCSDAADRLAPTDTTANPVWSVWGSLQLTEAVILSLREDPGGARRVLRRVRPPADRVGPGRNDYGEAFGPAWVGAHEVKVTLEMGDPVEALRLADHVEVDQLPTGERRARFALWAAHAHSLRRDDAAAVGWLVEAERHRGRPSSGARAQDSAGVPAP
ncbi:MAG: helix-turn-helix domain-containing protein [Egibacteraceae bacterium]